MTASSSPTRSRHGSAAVSPRPKGPPGGASAPDVTLAAKPSRDRDGFVPDLCRRFAAHLGGTAVSYDDVVVDESALSAFQRELLAAARSLAWGEVVTYGGLAALAGRPRAARAAGSFCAANRWSLVVPCHRVVAAGRESRRARRLRPLGARAQATAARARGHPAVSTRVAGVGRARGARGPRPRAPLRPARGDLRALPHRRRRPSPRPGGARVPPRPRGVVRRASGVRRPAEPQGRLGDPHVPPSRVRPGRAHATSRRGLARTRSTS